MAAEAGKTLAEGDPEEEGREHNRQCLRLVVVLHILVHQSTAQRSKFLRQGKCCYHPSRERGEERGSEKNLADEDNIDDHKEKTLQKVYCVKDLLGDILRVIVLSIFGILFIRNACLWSGDEC